jgi:CDP-diacylglycerol pyrophosphatase
MIAVLLLASGCHNRNKLWELVHACDAASAPGCVALAGGPAALQACEAKATGTQCVAVGPKDAVLKDIHGKLQYLLLPRARRTGIESMELLTPDEPDYFQDAWAARSFMENRAGTAIPRDAVGLSVNSADARSQDQLHIHIDCLRPDVRDALRRHAGEMSERWAPLGEPLDGVTYLARRVRSLSPDPLKLLAEGIPGARAGMEHYTLVVAGATFPDGTEGWYLLADHSSGLHRAHGEDLQDHDCRILGG